MRRFILALTFLALVTLCAPFVGQVDAAQIYDGYNLSQWEVIAQIYRYADHYGLTDADRELMLRIGYRETQYGLDITGDYDVVLGRDLSIGIFQFHEFGIWRSTPFYRDYGLAGRWNTELNVAAAAYCFNRGMQSHWYPWLRVRWLQTVPPDPRPWLWGGPHPPSINSFGE